MGWPIDRLAVLDRLVLRLAVAELLSPDGPPMPVVIDEAVELAKSYSTEASGGFVNGVLSTVAAQVRPAGRGARFPVEHSSHRLGAVGGVRRLRHGTGLQVAPERAEDGGTASSEGRAAPAPSLQGALDFELEKGPALRDRTEGQPEAD